jgi:hypothetical protein
MEIETIQTLISTVGFPIAVTMWFMLRTETVIKANTEALSRIGVIISDCTKKKP